MQKGGGFLAGGQSRCLGHGSHGPAGRSAGALLTHEPEGGGLRWGSEPQFAQ